MLHQYRSDPVAFVREVLQATPWDKQARILEALRDHSRVTVRSAHGVGKSWVAACAVLWFLYTRDPVTVLTTAPTQRQVREILWREIRRLHAQANRPAGARWPFTPRIGGRGADGQPVLPGKCTANALRVSESAFALGLTTDEADRFQGFHAPHLLVVVDEASGVPEPIFDAIDGVLTSGETRLLLIGNPTNVAGRFYDSHSRPAWARFAISALESPNVVGVDLDDEKQVRAAPARYPGLVTARWVADRRADWGEDSPLYQSRVLAEFPTSSEDSLIPLAWIHQAFRRYRQPAPSDSPQDWGAGGAGPELPELPENPYESHTLDYRDFEKERQQLAREIERIRSGRPRVCMLGRPRYTDYGVPWNYPRSRQTMIPGFEGKLAYLQSIPSRRPGQSDGRVEIGVDLARFGTSESVLYVRQGDRVVAADAWRRLDLMAAVGRIKARIERHRPVCVKIDSIGLGAGVVDRLRELGCNQVIGVNVARSPWRPHRYATLRDEIYFALRDRFQAGRLALPQDDLLARQLASLRYSYTSRGQYRIQSKDEMRSRGLPSPDRADALALCFAPLPPGYSRPVFRAGRPRPMADFRSPY